MKKTYYIFMLAVVAVATLAISCVRELDIVRPVNGNQATIRLTPVCIDPATKADGDNPEPGNNTYNENKIDGYYWFICNDEAGSNILLGGYTEGNGDTERPIDSSFPIQNGDGWVYVVANLPVKPKNPVAGDEWFEFVAPTSTNTAGIKHVIQGGTTTTYTGNVSNLKSIPFGKSTPVVNNSIVAGQSEFYNYTSATTGVPAPERFVMRTEEPVKFTITPGSGTEVTAELKRVAVKIILDLFVAEEVEQTKTQPTGLEDYVKTWYSDISHIQIYMLWGSTHSDLAGTPASYSNEHADWFYFASPRYAMYKNPDGGRYDNTTNSVLGTVPSSLYTSVEKEIESTVWEVVYQRQWIWNDDVPEEERINNNQDDDHGHWGDFILDENDNKIPVVGPDGTVQRQPAIKTEQKPYYQISSLPLYTMPISWNVNDAHAPFIKVILPWQGYNKDTNTWDTKNGDKKTTEFYYKILIPELTKLDANGCYHIKLDLSVLGSTADEVPVEIDGKYHVVSWNAPMQAMGGDQTAGRYLDCATHFEFYSKNEMEIPVRSSHNISVVLTGTNAPKTSYNNYYTGNTGSLTLSTSSATGDNYMISTSGNNKVILSHTLEANLDDMASRDVAPITYTFRIQHSDDAKYFKDITVVQYPSIYIKADPNTGYNDRWNYYSGYGMYQDNNGPLRSGYTFVNTSSYQYGNYWYNTSMLYNTGNANRNMYVVTTTVLSKPDQVIGDPRIKATSVITDFTGTPSNYGWVTAPALNGSSPRKLSAGYLQAESSSRTVNMIAPVIRTASSFGATNPFDFDTATRRCAGYQEDGRPAGRWRLPTAAEIKYLVNLSAQSLLPRLFGQEGETTTYWSANGTVTVSGNTVTPSESTSGSHYVRCVYDEWYWGSETLSDRTVFTWGDEYSAN